MSISRCVPERNANPALGVRGLLLGFLCLLVGSPAVTEGRTLWMTYAVLGSFFLATVAFSTHHVTTHLRIAEMVVLLFAVMLDLAAGRVTQRQASWVLGALLFFTGTVAVWQLFVGHPAAGGGYLTSAILYVAYLVALVAYAACYYEREIFLRVFYNLGRIEIAVALAGFAISKATHHVILVNALRSVRLQGTLSEPSAWGALVAPMLILAWHRRDWLWIVLTVAAGIASESPTVMVVTAFSVLLFWFLTGGAKIQKWFGVAALVIAIPYGIGWVSHANYQAMLQSSSGVKIAEGRLLQAYHSVGSDLQAGPTQANANERLSSDATVINEVRGTPKMWTGWGLGASDKYFPAVYGLVEDHTLWLTALFDLGAVAAGLVIFIGGRAVWRVRKRPAEAAIFIPMVVYAFANSAGGWDAYQIPVIGMILFGLGLSRWKEVSGDRLPGGGERHRVRPVPAHALQGAAVGAVN